MVADRMVAGVELGGTKSIAVIGRGDTILDSFRVPTTTPGETLGALAAKLAEWRRIHRPEAIGIASFGPISVEQGRMLPTPKPHWAGADIVGPVAEALARLERATQRLAADGGAIEAYVQAVKHGEFPQDALHAW